MEAMTDPRHSRNNAITNQKMGESTSALVLTVNHTF
jgi:hypothetical protein